MTSSGAAPVLADINAALVLPAVVAVLATYAAWEALRGRGVGAERGPYA